MTFFIALVVIGVLIFLCNKQKKIRGKGNYFSEVKSAYNDGNWHEHFKVSKKHALAGDINAQNDVGFCYEKGLGVTQDYFEASKWYKLAAEQGLDIAINNIGYMYLYGMGVLQDYDEAFKCFKLAAEKNIDQAQHNLGVMFEKGLGVKQDCFEAVRWYRLAAKQGNVDAKKFLDDINFKKLGFEKIGFTINQYGVGNAYTLVNLGIVHDYANGVAENFTQALNMMQLAAESGDAFAQLTLGVIYNFGYGVLQDAKKAFNFYTAAAKAGLAEAQNNLGFLYDTGNGVEQDYVMAHKWYNVAAANGYENGKYNRDEIAKLLTSEQIKDAQNLAKKCPLVKS